MLETYHFKEETSVPSPALIYYRDILVKNTETAIQKAGLAERLWPHVKSHKSRDFTQLQTEMGIKKFKCATIPEAEMAAQTDAKEILLAYPSKTFYALGDNLEQLSIFGKLAGTHNISFKCLADVNTGMNRTGVTLPFLASFYKELHYLPGIIPSGFHCYDGNCHEKDYTLREKMVGETIKAVNSIGRSLTEEGYFCPLLIMGGSPAFPCYAENMKQVYYSPGTVFIYDQGYKEQFPDLPYIPGAAIASRVISHPKAGYFTLDRGCKAISAEQEIRGVIPELPHASEAFQSEEHWTFCMDEGFEKERPAIGTIVYIIPWHICPTSALYEKAYVVSSGSLIGEWPISARNRMLFF